MLFVLSRRASLLAPFTLLLAGLVIAARPTRAATAAQQANAFQLNAAHTGSITLPGFGTSLARIWSVDLGQQVSYPLIADGRVFVATADNSSPNKRVTALDLATGNILWQQPVPGYYWRVDIAHENGRVFIINTDGLLVARDAATGNLLWQVQLPGQYMFTSPPTPYNGVVYVGGAGSGGTLYAVSETNGAVLWTRSVANGDHSSPAVTDDGVYVSYAGPQVYKFALNGTPLWHYNSGISGGGGATPAYYNTRLYVRSAYTGQVFDATSGALQTQGWPMSYPPAFDSGRMYFLRSGALFAVDAASLAPLWSIQADSTMTSAPIVVNGRVYVGTYGGSLWAFDGATGTPLWHDTVGAGVVPPDEFNVSATLTGLAAGEGAIVVPAGHLLTAFAPAADTAPPTTTLTVKGLQGTNGWFRSSVEVTLTASDGIGSGVAGTYYHLGGAAAQPYTGPITLPGDAVYSFFYYSVDNAGNTETTQSRQLQVDTTAPTLQWGALTPAPNAAGWNNGSVSLPYTTADNLSGVAPSSAASPLNFTAEGAGQTRMLTVRDNAGNSATFTSPAVNIDLTAPSTALKLTGPQAANGAFTSAVQVALTASDALSGVAATYYTLDGGAPTAYTGAVTVSGEGTHTLSYWSVDAAGNTESAHTAALTIDSTGPATLASVNAPAGNNGWLTGPAQVTLSASDPSGIAATYYQVDGGATQTYSGAFTVSGDGAHTVAYWSVDGAGNEGAHGSLPLKIDATAPTLSWGTATPAPNGSGWYQGSVSIPYTASDATSGVQSVTPGSPLVISGEGSNLTGSVTVTDAAGNSATFTSPAVKMDRTAPVITAAGPGSLSSNGPKTRSVTISGKITDALSGIAPGTATFRVTDEYGTVQPSGSITLQADGSYSFSVTLETHTNKKDSNGRVYTVTVQARDRADNTGSATTTVTFR